MKKDDFVSGLIISREHRFAFSLQNFRVTIFCIENDKTKIVIEPDDNGYIWGKTSDNRCIAIYVGERFGIVNTRVVNTWNYIISQHQIEKEEMNSFSGIRFVNGAVKTVFPCGAIEEKKEIEKELIKQKKECLFVYGIIDDLLEFDSFDSISPVKWKYFSVVNQGGIINNSDSHLEILFEKPRAIKSFYDYYGYVSTVHEFLVFRRNVYFEKVILFNTIDDYQEELADCYVKPPESVENRDFYHSIYVRLADKDEFQNIIRNAISADEKKEYLPSEIIPRDEKDFGIITGEKIWCLCSAIEKELDISGIHLTKTESMNELINQVKDVVKKHRKGNSPLPMKTYDRVFGSISHWNDSLSDRIEKVWEENFNELEPLFSFYGVEKEYIDIKKLVKKRNSITHEGFKEIDNQEFYTYLFLKGLLYSLTLKRIGMDSDKIKGIMERRFIG